MYETLQLAFEHRSVTEYDRMSARARRLDPLLTGDWETHQRMSKMHNIIFKSTKKTVK